TEIVQERDTHVCLTTPSATRIYRTAAEPAILETKILLEEGATLEYFPDHVIPHGNSALRQSFRLDMAPGSRAIVLDSMSSGRVAHGERWSFTELDSRFEVRVGGRPAFLNRTRIIPASRSPRQLGVMEEYDYMASMGLFADGFAGWPAVVAALNEELRRTPDVHGGVSLLPRGGCIARCLARSASDMISMSEKLRDTGRALLLQRPAFDQRKY
ncbi:MAG: urease accessory protein UreD, partial [Candidatus Acidiferrales bacterium]